MASGNFVSNIGHCRQRAIITICQRFEKERFAGHWAREFGQYRYGRSRKVTVCVVLINILQTNFSSRRKVDFWYDFVKENKIKAFVEHTTCPTLRLGAEQLLRLSGLGGMKANTLVLNIDDDLGHDITAVVKDALCLEKNVVLFSNIESLNRQLLSVCAKRDMFFCKFVYKN